MEEHSLASSRYVIDDAGNGIEFDGIANGPNSSFRGKSVLVAIPVLVDTDSELHKEQVLGEITITDVFYQLGTETEAFPFFAPRRSFISVVIISVIAATARGN